MIDFLQKGYTMDVAIRVFLGGLVESFLSMLLHGNNCIFVVKSVNSN
jgi:hypothetical protein